MWQKVKHQGREEEESRRDSGSSTAWQKTREEKEVEAIRRMREEGREKKGSNSQVKNEIVEALL